MRWPSSAEAALGWTAADTVGEMSTSFMPDVPGREGRRAQLRREGHWEGVVLYLHKTGETIAAQATTTSILSAAGKLVGYAVRFVLTSPRAARIPAPRDPRAARIVRRRASRKSLSPRETLPPEDESVSIAVSASRDRITALIGRNIVQARKLAGMSQGDVVRAQAALTLDDDDRLFEVKELSWWENAHRRPSDRYLQRIALIVGQTFSWFFEEHE